MSWERVVSGPGLYSIYQHLREESGETEPDWLGARCREGDGFCERRVFLHMPKGYRTRIYQCIVGTALFAAERCDTRFGSKLCSPFDIKIGTDIITGRARWQIIR